MLVIKALTVHDAQWWLLSAAQVMCGRTRNETTEVVGGTAPSCVRDACRMPARRSRLGDKSAGGGGKLTVGIVMSLHRMLWTFACFERCTSQRHPHIVWKLSMSCAR